jgi:hypothetical protein
LKSEMVVFSGSEVLKCAEAIIYFWFIVSCKFN